MYYKLVYQSEDTNKVNEICNILHNHYLTFVMGKNTNLHLVYMPAKHFKIARQLVPNLNR